MKYARFAATAVMTLAGLQGVYSQPVGVQEISLVDGNLGSGALAFSDYFGSSIASVGDIDGDGVLDLAVGAEGDDEGGRDTGSIRLLLMNGDGTVKSSSKIGASQLPSGALDAGDYFGSSVAGLQDLDGDGFRDIVVGARGDDDAPAGTEESSGAIWVVFLDDAGAVLGSQKISSVQGGFAGALDAGDLFGRSIAFLGDIGEDGTKEIAVGASGDDDGGPDRGAVWILSLRPDGTVAESAKISDIAGLEDYDAFGTSVALITTLEGGGVTFVAGSPFSDTEVDEAGKFWFTDLRPGLVPSETMQANTVVSGMGLSPGDHFGRSLASPGDLNQNGSIDLLVGNPGRDETVDDAGEFWFLDVQPGATVVELDRVASPESTPNPGDRFGQSMAAIGDLDGDGKTDYAIGAPFGDDGLENSGSVYVVFDDRAEPVSLEPLVPLTDVLMAPFPNPLSAEGVLGIRLASGRHVRVEVFDLSGRRVATIHDGLLPAGTLHELSIDATLWPSGTYVYRVIDGEDVRARSFVVVK